MFSRILVLALVLGASSAYAAKNSARLEIGVGVCEAFPEDCTDSGQEFYHIFATVKGYQLNVVANFTSSPKSKWKRTLEISSSDAEVIALLVKQLEKVDVVREHFPAVCEIAVRPAQFVDFLSTANAKGKLRPVLGPTGCWVSDKIYPATNFESAKALKALLRPLVVKAAFSPGVE